MCCYQCSCCLHDINSVKQLKLWHFLYDFFRVLVCFMGCSVLEDAKWSLELGDLGQSSSLRVKIEVYNCLNGQFYSGPWLGVHWLLSSSFLTPDKARSWHLGGSQEGAATPPGPLLHVNMQRTCDGERREGSLAAVGLNWCLKVYFETTTCSKCEIHILCRTSRVILGRSESWITRGWEIIEPYF